LDGNDGFLPFLQVGTIELNNDDFVCIHSDGFTQAIADMSFINMIRKSKFDGKLMEDINKYLRDKKMDKEKTAVFMLV